MKIKELYNKNQFIIEDSEQQKITFQSYQSTIVTIDNANNLLIIYPNWSYSQTTLKYFYLFLKENAKDVYNLLESDPNKKQRFISILKDFNGEQIPNTKYKLVYNS